MKQWWHHHSSKLPEFRSDDYKMKVEDLTGRIPLLLYPLLKWGGHDFSDIEDQFWADSDLRAVESNIAAFAKKVRDGHPDDYAK
jgi:hypothetical protein